MIPIFDYETMQRVDQYAIEQLGIDPLKLMEKAGLSMWELFLSHIKPSVSQKLLFLVGSGNNGADSLVIARRAYESGFHNLEVVIKKEEGSSLFELQLSRVRSLSIPVTLLADCERSFTHLFDSFGEKGGAFYQKIVQFFPFMQAKYVFDGICGIGTRGEFPIKQSEWAFLFETLLCSPVKPLFLAVDLPSGLSDDFFDCYPMNYTLTVQVPKKPFYHPKARSKCGKILIGDAGFPEAALNEGVRNVLKKGPALFIEESPSSLWPFDPATVHKRSRGELLLFAGSKKYEGAALLSSLAASRSGAGFVTLISDQSACQKALLLNAGLVVRRFSASLFSAREKAVVKLVGCGWDKSLQKKKALKKILSRSTAPLILDATALRLISETPFLLKALLFSNASSIILTPHSGEFEALYQAVLNYFSSIKRWLSSSTIVEGEGGRALFSFFEKEKKGQKVSLESRIFNLSRLLGVHLLYKGAVSLFSDGYSLSLFDSCRSYLAVAGSGDLLAAILASLLCTQEGKPIDEERKIKAAVLSALNIHALAADLCYQQVGWFDAAQLANYIGIATATLYPAIQTGGEAIALKEKADGKSGVL